MARKKYRAHKVREVGPDANIADYCSRHFPLLASKSAVKKAIADGRLLHNGKPARMGTKVSKGDRLELKGTGLHKAKKFDKELDIVYKDDHLLVVNKPAGIAVNGTRKQTVENALAGSVSPSEQPGALPRPIAVHRIDVPTKGLVLLARTKPMLIRLSKAFEDNEVSKEYMAVVHGQPPEKGLIDEPIDGKEAVTKFETLKTAPSRVYEQLSLVRLRPVTGRTHQLRIHMQQQGHLIVGDKAYAKGQNTILGKGLHLCACKLQFTHPATGKELKVELEPPRRFAKLLRRERERY